jgi:hypothetical protein
MDLSRLSTATKVISGAAVVLLIFTFFDWQQYCVSILGHGGCVGQNAWHGFTGVLMGLLVIVLIAWQAVKIFEIKLPDLPVEDKLIEAGVIGGLLVFTILKVITAGNYRNTWVQIVALVLAGVIGFFGWQRFSGSDDTAVAASAPAADDAPATPPAAAVPAAAAAPAPAAPATPPTPAAPAEPADEPDAPESSADESDADDSGDDAPEAPPAGSTY